MHSEGISQHPVWDALDNARLQLEGLAKNVIGAEVPPAFEILRSITVAETLKGIPLIFVAEEKLNQLTETAKGISQTVVTGLEDETEVVQQLSEYSQEMATTLLALPVNFHNDAGLGKYEQSAQNFVSTLASTADHLREKNNEADALLEDYERRVNEKQEQIDERFEKRQEELGQQLSGLQATVDEIKETIETQKTRLDEALNAFSEKSSAQVEAAEEKHAELRQEAEKQSSQQRQRIEEQAKAIVDQLTEYEDQASRLVESTAKGTISAEYGARANTERRAALGWSLGAVAVALAGLWVLVQGIGSIEAMTVSQTIWKSSVTLVLLAVAGYMGSEAGAHRKEERDAKRTQLDLNAIHPFLSQMNEADAAPLRKEFAQRVFSRPLANKKSHNGFRLWSLPTSSTEEKDSSQESQK